MANSPHPMLRHIPNLLSAIRLVLAPATAGFVASENFLAAFGIFAFAGFTDAIDGTLAKLLNCPTQFGKILDPLADKALMTAAFLALAFVGDVPWWLAATVIGRDVLIGAGYGLLLLAGRRIDTTPSFVGKLTTALQITYLAAHLAALAFGLSLGAAVPADAYILAALTAASALGYLWRGIAAARGKTA